MGVFRPIAIHLPQFHPIPENDEWWGRGFTEWRNVAKAKALFAGHAQPRIPADLGFYDLRLPEAREAQAELARAYGIYGFCYYHYWFHGDRLLQRPVDEILASGSPDFPFCLCWANETWSRRWLGEERDVLKAQTYSSADDAEHARWLARVFDDPRYIRVNDRPVFSVYNPIGMPEPERFVEALRRACADAEVGEPYLIGADARRAGVDARKWGFDNTLRFEPQLSALPLSDVDGSNLKRALRNVRHGVRSSKLKIYDYRRARNFMRFESRGYPEVPCVFVGWDNTPRRGENGVVIINSTPENFGAELEREVAMRSAEKRDHDLFFINAWNEWAEGNCLEPDMRHGHRYLEQVKRVFAHQPAAPVAQAPLPAEVQ